MYHAALKAINNLTLVENYWCFFWWSLWCRHVRTAAGWRKMLAVLPIEREPGGGSFGVAVLL